MMNKFKFGNANVMGVYFDEENRRHLNSIRLAYAQGASSLADAGKKEEAKKMLNKCDQMMLQENFPYGMVSRGQQHDQFSLQMLIAAYKAGDSALAKKISGSVKKDLDQQMMYLTNLPDSKQENMQQEIQGVQRLLMGMEQLKNQFENPAPVPTENIPPVKTQPVAPAKAADTAPKG
jgi:hypothetical protein